MIILLDLNYTLVENSHEKRSPFIKQIEIEEYRHWLIDLVRPHYVIMMTARPEKYYDDTLLNIIHKTGWTPERALFNESHRIRPPAAKKRMLHEEVFPVHGEDPTQYFAIESNPRTRSMYANHGIRAEHFGDKTWKKLPI